MSIKLGELLIKHAMVTEDQLAKGLRAQQLYGSRLGTNLVELGFLSEQGLTKFLSAQLGIPAIDSGSLDSIPSDALSALPRPTAEKYRVIPLGFAGRKLRVATADPTDLKVLDEVSFATGFGLQVFVAPELLITYALEKYYGTQRPTRYVRLTGMEEGEFEVIQPMDAAHRTTTSLPGDRVHFEDRGDFFQQERKDLLQTAYDIKQASKDLASVSQSKDVFDVLKRFAAQHFERGLIFVVRGDRMIGWDQIGCSVSETDLRRVSLALNESTLLEQALESQLAWIGTVPASQSGNWMASQLKLKQDRSAFALPITVDHRLVGVLLASGSTKGELADHLVEYDALAQKLSYSLQITALQKRILQS